MVLRRYLVTLVIPELLSNMSLAPGLKSPDASKMESSAQSKRGWVLGGSWVVISAVIGVPLMDL